METSAEYIQAIKDHNAALAVFGPIQAAYRARKIGDAEYLAGRKVMEEANKAFDLAFSAEQSRNV